MDVLSGASKDDVSSIPETSTSASTTGIPSLAHRMASARPKPLPAPVITATRPVRLFISEILGSNRRTRQLAIASDRTTGTTTLRDSYARDCRYGDKVYVVVRLPRHSAMTPASARATGIGHPARIPVKH